MKCTRVPEYDCVSIVNVQMPAALSPQKCMEENGQLVKPELQLSTLRLSKRVDDVPIGLCSTTWLELTSQPKQHYDLHQSAQTQISWCIQHIIIMLNSEKLFFLFFLTMLQHNQYVRYNSL